MVDISPCDLDSRFSRCNAHPMCGLLISFATQTLILQLLPIVHKKNSLNILCGSALNFVASSLHTSCAHISENASNDSFGSCCVVEIELTRIDDVLQYDVMKAT